MLARLAENLFWAGRYLERAENTALVLDVTYHGLLESPPQEAVEGWQSLLRVLHVEDTFAERHRDTTAEAVTDFLVLDVENPGSITSAVGLVRENTRSVRELVSSELWQAVNTFFLDLKARDLRGDIDTNAHELFEMVTTQCHLLYGVASETMPRDDGWRFLMLGRLLERAAMTCRLLNVRYAQLSEQARAEARFHDWVMVLKCASAFEAYRKSYRATMEPARVVEFLLLSGDVPRSVLFCLRAAENGLSRLSPPGMVSRPQRLLGRIRAELEFRELEELMTDELGEVLDDIEVAVWTIAEAVAEQFFRHDLAADLDLQQQVIA